MRYKYVCNVPAVVGYLSMKKAVCEVSNTKEFSKPTGSVLDQGASYHASTVGIE